MTTAAHRRNYREFAVRPDRSTASRSFAASPATRSVRPSSRPSRGAPVRRRTRCACRRRTRRGSSRSQARRSGGACRRHRQASSRSHPDTTRRWNRRPAKSWAGEPRTREKPPPRVAGAAPRRWRVPPRGTGSPCGLWSCACPAFRVNGYASSHRHDPDPRSWRRCAVPDGPRWCSSRSSRSFRRLAARFANTPDPT